MELRLSMNVKAPVPSQCRKFSNSQQKFKSKFPLHHPERNQELCRAFCRTIFQVGSYAQTLSIYKYILRHCDRHNFTLLTSLNHKYFQV